MKVTVNEVEAKKDGFKYPVLMQYSAGTPIVLFTSEFSGTVVVAGLGYKIGFTCDRFESCKNTDEWKKFEGTITLEND